MYTIGHKYWHTIMKILCSHAGSIELVMLFGSRARGDARATSDIDLAVWLEENSPLDKGASL